MDPKIFRAYDIRGVYPIDLNEEYTSKIAKGIFTFFVKKLGLNRPLKVVLGYDGRLSSPSLAKEARRALIESGANVVEIGLASTPTFYFSLSHYDFDAGLQISASHNPKEYNGVKFAMRTDHGITKIGKDTGMDEVKRLTLAEKFVSLEKKGKLVKKKDVLKDQIAKAFKLLGEPKVGKLKVVADAANAVGALYLEALFAQLPCPLIKMNFGIDGNFPAHQPDPLQFETLADLRRKVLEEKADLGIAPDGDGDRVFFIDEKGEIVAASLVTALIAQEILKSNPRGKIVYDVRDKFNAEHAILKNGGVPVVTRVGHALITETMKKENAIFAGENSGHYFFKETGFAEDPLPVILTVLSVMTREAKPISKILEKFKVAFESGEINFRTENAEKIKQIIQEKYKDGKIELLDGLSIEYPNWRFNLRPSNTEPLLRLNVEARSEGLMEEKRDELLDLIKSYD